MRWGHLTHALPPVWANLRRRMARYWSTFLLFFVCILSLFFILSGWFASVLLFLYES